MITITKTTDFNTFSYQDGQNEPMLLQGKLNKKTGRFFLALPENEFNRKFVECSAVEKNGGRYEIMKVKETRVLGSSTTEKKSTKKVNWQEYLTDEEKELIESIRVKAERRAEKAKIEAEIARLTAQLNQD